MSEKPEEKEVVKREETQEEISLEVVQRKAKLLSSSDLVPDQYKGGTPKAIANCIIAMQVAESIGANVLMVMQNLYVIKGKPSWSSQFIISAVNGCGKFSPLRFVMDGEGPTLSCRATALELATGEKIEGPLITMKMAKEEGWIDKPMSKWKTMPEMMIRYRAASFFGKLYAPELLNGMGTEEEALDVDAQEKIVGPGEEKPTPETVKSKLKAQSATPDDKENPDKNGKLDIY